MLGLGVGVALDELAGAGLGVAPVSVLGLGVDFGVDGADPRLSFL